MFIQEYDVRELIDGILR